MSPISAERQKEKGVGGTDARNYARAILNILDDAGDERGRLQDAQRAVLNILDDFSTEKLRLEATQKAILNILADSAEEKAQLGDAQHAVLNILDDIDLEKKKIERANSELAKEIAERQRAQEALLQAKTATETANRELESFSYSVAHDLRAPLRIMDGFAKVLLREYGSRLDAEGDRYLERICKAAQRMGGLIDDLLNLSSVGRVELRREGVDLSALARAVLARLRDSEPGRQAELVVEDGLAAQADPRLLEIVLTNLLGNAWKFTAHQPQARIEFGQAQGAPESVFFVRDNGAGFEMRYADKLFKPFQRLHSEAEFKGSGIGLATVQRIVFRHGGRIWAEAAAGQGATFFFTLGRGP